MSRTVFCRKYQQELEGLPSPPYPGVRGQDIFEHVSRQAWMDWLKHQTMLINEKRLNLLEPSTQAYLQEEFDKFMSGEEYEKPEGYVPPSL